MVNWIAKNRTVLSFKLGTSAKLKCVNGTVLHAKLICLKKLFLTLKLYLRYTELFEIEQLLHLTVSKQKLYLQ